MSSTRNLNTPYNYKCEQNKNDKIINYVTNKMYGEQEHAVQMFDLGSNPSSMNGKHFSYNHIDIESKLRGICSTNMVGASFDPELQKKSFSTTKIFNNTLKENHSVPSSFMHNSNERYGFHNI